MVVSMNGPSMLDTFPLHSRAVSALQLTFSDAMASRTSRTNNAECGDKFLSTEIADSEEEEVQPCSDQGALSGTTRLPALKELALSSFFESAHDPPWTCEKLTGISKSADILIVCHGHLEAAISRIS